MAAYLLHKVKIVLRNNRLMGVFDDKPVLLRIFIQLLVFVGFAVGLEVDRVTEISAAYTLRKNQAINRLSCYKKAMLSNIRRTSIFVYNMLFQKYFSKPLDKL